MPLCSRLRPDVRDRRVRETDVRRQTKASLNTPAYEGIIYYYAPPYRREHNNVRCHRRQAINQNGLHPATAINARTLTYTHARTWVSISLVHCPLCELHVYLSIVMISWARRCYRWSSVYTCTAVCIGNWRERMLTATRLLSLRRPVAVADGKTSRRRWRHTSVVSTVTLIGLPLQSIKFLYKYFLNTKIQGVHVSLPTMCAL